MDIHFFAALVFFVNLPTVRCTGISSIGVAAVIAAHSLKVRVLTKEQDVKDSEHV